MREDFYSKYGAVVAGLAHTKRINQTFFLFLIGMKLELSSGFTFLS